MQLECCYIAYSDELFPSIIPFFPAVLIGHRTHPCSGFCVQASVSCAHILGYLHKLWFFALFINVILLELTVSISTESYNTHTHTYAVRIGMRASSVWPVLMTVTRITNVLLCVCDGFWRLGAKCLSMLAGNRPKDKTELCLKRVYGLPDLNIFERFSPFD